MQIPYCICLFVYQMNKWRWYALCTTVKLDWSVHLQPPDSLKKEWIAVANGKTGVRIFLARKQSEEKKEVISIKAGLWTKNMEQLSEYWHYLWLLATFSSPLSIINSKNPQHNPCCLLLCLPLFPWLILHKEPCKLTAHTPVQECAHFKWLTVCCAPASITMPCVMA